MKSFRNIKQSGLFVIVILLVLYFAYITKELCIKLQGLQKLKRLKMYESEIDELTNKLADFHKDSSNVKKSLDILKEILSDLVLLQKQNNKLENKVPKKHPKDINIHHKPEAGVI